MPSSVLNSERAILMNIVIMRTFIKLRSFLALESGAIDDVKELRSETLEVFKVVFKRLDKLDELVAPALSTRRRKISLK